MGEVQRPSENSTTTVDLSIEGVRVGDLYLSAGPEPIKTPEGFSLNAPLCCINIYRCGNIITVTHEYCILKTVYKLLIKDDSEKVNASCTVKGSSCAWES